MRISDWSSDVCSSDLSVGSIRLPPVGDRPAATAPAQCEATAAEATVSGLILYGNKESGHSYKVALALALLGVEHAYRAVDLTVPRPDRPAEFQAVSRFGEVPLLVLVAEGRTPLAQSNAILLHMARTPGTIGGAAT